MPLPAFGRTGGEASGELETLLVAGAQTAQPPEYLPLFFFHPARLTNLKSGVEPRPDLARSDSPQTLNRE